MSEDASIGKILLVDDEENITQLLKFNLEAERFFVTVVDRAARVAGLDIVDYRLVLLDCMRQPYSGMDLLHDLKSNPLTAHIPVIILSSDDSEDSIITALEDGADDYVLKPFSLREMVARIRSVFRRHPVQTQQHSRNAGTISFGDGLEVDLIGKQVRLDGQLLSLTKTEYAILIFLLRNKNRFFKRMQIYDEVWRESDSPVNDRIVDTNISRLRKKLGHAAAALVNRTGQGYAMVE